VQDNVFGLSEHIALGEKADLLHLSSSRFVSSCRLSQELSSMNSLLSPANDPITEWVKRLLGNAQSEIPGGAQDMDILPRRGGETGGSLNTYRTYDSKEDEKDDYIT
jgi:hypothetical protein